MNNTLFEQFSGTYTKQGDYLLPNLILPAEAETGYIEVWGQHRLNYLKPTAKFCITICSLPGNSIPTLPIPRNKPTTLFSAGK